MQAPYVQITLQLPRTADVSDRVSQIVGTTLAADGRVVDIVNQYPIGDDEQRHVAELVASEEPVSNGRGRRPRNTDETPATV